MSKNPHCVLTIAGTDPSGGAGIQADMKTIHATGSYAASIITAVVAQNTQGVQGILPMPSEFVLEQFNSVFNDLEIYVIKIGMLHNAKIIDVVAQCLEKQSIKYVVIDPVMVTKSNDKLLDFESLIYLEKRLFPFATILTPNKFEAEKLLNREIKSYQEMEMATKELGLKYKINILIKGGHFNEESCSDVLYSVRENKISWFKSERIITKNHHGTGCTLSSAISSYLAQDYSLNEAVHLAKKYTFRALQEGVDFKIGKGCGPLNHHWS